MLCTFFLRSAAHLYGMPGLFLNTFSRNVRFQALLITTEAHSTQCWFSASCHLHDVDFLYYVWCRLCLSCRKAIFVLLCNPAPCVQEFVREGSLYKLSRKGFQQRLFFLFSGCLLYTSKGVTSTNQFKVHGELPLQGMIVRTHVESCHAFNLSGLRPMCLSNHFNAARKIMSKLYVCRKSGRADGGRLIE